MAAALVVAVLCAVCSRPAAALEEGVQRGIAFLAGGVTIDERAILAHRAHEFNLRVVTAIARSGEYLSDVHIDVHRGGDLVFDRTAAGPWLFLRVPPGRYTITANANGVLRRQDVDVRATDSRPLTLYWRDDAGIPQPRTPAR